jgi:hypothetical protein
MFNEGLWCVLITKCGKWFKNNGFIGQRNMNKNDPNTPPNPRICMSSCKQELVNLYSLYTLFNYLA